MSENSSQEVNKVDFKLENIYNYPIRHQYKALPRFKKPIKGPDET